MLDIVKIRENPQEIADALSKKGVNCDIIYNLIKLDENRRENISLV